MRCNHLEETVISMIILLGEYFATQGYTASAQGHRRSGECSLEGSSTWILGPLRSRAQLAEIRAPSNVTSYYAELGDYITNCSCCTTGSRSSRKRYCDTQQDSVTRLRCIGNQRRLGERTMKTLRHQSTGPPRKTRITGVFRGP